MIASRMAVLYHILLLLFIVCFTLGTRLSLEIRAHASRPSINICNSKINISEINNHENLSVASGNPNYFTKNKYKIGHYKFHQTIKLTQK